MTLRQKVSLCLILNALIILGEWWEVGGSAKTNACSKLIV
jgi:hypothetical protein